MRWEKGLAWVLVVWAFVLHLTFFVHAGALWRDEANSIQQASLTSWREVCASLEYDAFPILYPALLRLWSSHPATASDTGLRFLGLMIGVAGLFSLWFVARLLGARLPIVTLALAAISPVMIIEGDSVRPYGVSILCLLWTFGLLGKYLLQPDRNYLVFATLFAILSVQASYTNALFVGLFALCAGWVIVAKSLRGRLWGVLVPPTAAALSLLPYLPVLRRAQDWTALTRYRIDWSQLARAGLWSYGAPSILLALGSLSFAAWAVYSLAKARKTNEVSPAALYAALAAGFGLLIQVAFLLMLRAPAFPRYFLPCLVLAALACEFLFRADFSPLRRLVVIAALVSTAWPAWMAVQSRRSNVDAVARVLNHQARPEDLVIISPWFLNTSFQRYYRGSAPWITIPEMEQYPMMRYDLVKRAMLAGTTGEEVAEDIGRAVAGGGVLWFVSQRMPEEIRESPTPPAMSEFPDGTDYARFRSFRERDIEHRLRQRGAKAVFVLPHTESTWREERLILTRWAIPR